MTNLESILERLASGEISQEYALNQILSFQGLTVEATTVDHERARRTGAAEVIYAEFKTPKQIFNAFSSILENGDNALATRIKPDAAEFLQHKLSDVEYRPEAKLAFLQRTKPKSPTTMVGVVAAGTSDLGVAEEAAITAEFYGNKVSRFYDVGVAGVHRLLSRIEPIRECRVLAVVAGMEGALPSVVAGLVSKPVIAVPTSVGYGASFNGITALLGMLTSCATGVSVVNIDNGFGAGYLANVINRL